MSVDTSGIGWVTGVLIGPLVVFLVVAGMGLFVVAFLIYAGVCALFGGVLVFGVSRLFRTHRPPDFTTSYRAVFLGYAVALLVDGVRSWRGGGTPDPLQGLTAAPDSVLFVFSPELVGSFMHWLWPGIPVAALVLALTSPVYRGPAGVLRGVAVATFALPGSLLLPLAFLINLDLRWTAMGRGTDLGEILLALLVLWAGVSGLGGLLARPLLSRAGPMPLLPGPNSPKVSLGTAWMAVGAWAAVTGVLAFFVPLVDPFQEGIAQALGSERAPAALASRWWLLPGALAAFAVVQAPGVWAAARIVAWRRRLPWAEPGMRRQVLETSAVAVTTVWPLVGVLFWFLAGIR